MRGFAGYNFKDGRLNDSQRQTLEDYLHAFEEIEGANELKVGKRTYLMRPKNGVLSIFGVGPDNEEKSNGIVWGTNEQNILQSLYYVQMMDFAYPYKVEENAVYMVEDGEVYIVYRKGDRVNTTDGEGTIFSIDGLHDICVELDHHDPDVLYEFNVNEIGTIKKKDS